MNFFFNFQFFNLKEGVPFFRFFYKINFLFLKSLFNFKFLNLFFNLKFVDKEEMFCINFKYRNKRDITNIIIFSTDDNFFDFLLLGDIIICFYVVKNESLNKKFDFKFYLSYLLIHGLLHLSGYNHVNNKEAFFMEFLENFFMKKID